MSVFKRQREHPMPIKCKRGHALVRFEVAECETHSIHKVFICPMRRGSKTCGDILVLPPFTPACAEKDEDD